VRELCRRRRHLHPLPAPDASGADPGAAAGAVHCSSSPPAHPCISASLESKHFVISRRALGLFRTEPHRGSSDSASNGTRIARTTATLSALRHPSFFSPHQPPIRHYCCLCILQSPSSRAEQHTVLLHTHAHVINPLFPQRARSCTSASRDTPPVAVSSLGHPAGKTRSACPRPRTHVLSCPAPAPASPRPHPPPHPPPTTSPSTACGARTLPTAHNYTDAHSPNPKPHLPQRIARAQFPVPAVI